MKTRYSMRGAHIRNPYLIVLRSSKKQATMQTRASKAGRFNNSPSTRSRKAAAAASTAVVTPSPPRKKSRSNGRLCSSQNLSGRKIILPSHETNSAACIDTSSTRDEIRKLVNSRITDTPCNDINTETLGGWCLVEGLTHCASVSNGILAPLIKEHGPPPFYIDRIKKRERDLGASEQDGYESFRSLCRIVAGQQLAGNTAKKIWLRLLGVVEGNEDDTSSLNPENILSLVKDGDMETHLRAPAGLSKNKCMCIVEIAKNFQNDSLSEPLSDNFFRRSSDDEVRARLIAIKGLGPWSVDMFLLFQCHRPNILPVGDFAFRKGTAKLWGIKGDLCQKKDANILHDKHAPFKPYRSISSYYMYKCLEMKG